jgi:putative PIN family toxin of toxin-antitoxin system
MSSSARYVLDTNTLMSAVLFEHSTPGQAFRRALKRGAILASPATVEELAEVFQREKFDRYVTAAEREEFLEAFVEGATFIEPTEEIRICRDAKDDKFLELAVSGGAAYLVSGDNDLRSLNPFRGIAIVTAAEFLAATSEEETV